MTWQKIQNGFLNMDKVYFIEVTAPSVKTNPVRVIYYLSPIVHEDEAIVDFFKNIEEATETLNKLLGHS